MASTIFWLAAIVLAAMFGLFVGGAGRIAKDYDADSERAFDILRADKPQSRKQSEMVMISPTESRAVKSWPALTGSGNPEAHDYAAGSK